MPLKIAVDAMGGDFAPLEAVKGALVVARERPDLEIVLVGSEAAVSETLNALGDVPSTVTVRVAEQAIEMGEHPVQATRRKRESSLVVSGLMVKSGEADATFSAGSTGAAMAIATLDIGRIPGIERPALATGIPTIQGRALLLDAGASVDCTVRNLRQFALLGAIYAERVLGVPNPTVGLLNIGTEDGKGNELAKEAFHLLKSTSLNFVGNVEGKGVFDHAVDVVVCDGFWGNVLVKSGEGMAEMIFELLHRMTEAEPKIAAFQDVFDAIFKRLAQRIHYSEFGGATLLGVSGVSVIGHGRSDAKAIAGGIRAAADAAAGGYVQAICDALPAFEGKA